MEALRSAGPAGSPTITDARFTTLEEKLDKESTMHDFDEYSPAVLGDGANLDAVMVKEQEQCSVPVDQPVGAGGRRTFPIDP